MRILLSKESKKELFNLLKTKYSCKNIFELSKKINLSVKTLQGWFYLQSRTIPSEFINNENISNLKIIEKKEDHWGQIIGGNQGYLKVINKYGINEFKKINAKGGKLAAITKEKYSKKELDIDVTDIRFLEFYGILLGDGWLSNFISKGRKIRIVGFCTNLKNERKFAEYYHSLVENLFNRHSKLRNIPKYNVVEHRFSYNLLIKYLNEKLNFPIGKKENLKIPYSIISQGFSKVKYVIRGIFDTDGSFYLQKNKKGIPTHPIISIHMNELKLISQIGEILKKEGFRINYSDYGKMIKIQGKIQLKKWLNEIGSSNPFKREKMEKVANS